MKAAKCILKVLLLSIVVTAVAEIGVIGVSDLYHKGIIPGTIAATACEAQIPFVVGVVVMLGGLKF